MKIGVLSVVHHADDVRIREKLIRTLQSEHDVHYQTRQPAPTDQTGIVWSAFEGSRFRRNVALLTQVWSRQFDVVVLVDPETFLTGIVCRNRATVVFDVHENVPEQIRTKQVPARSMLARVARSGVASPRSGRGS